LSPEVGVEGGHYGVKNKIMKLVYTAVSKKLFYFRMHISKFVLEKNCIPLNPFMLWEYFMLDTVERDKIRKANNTLVEKVDELWVFGKVSDGVLKEIELAKKMGKPIKYFAVVNSKEIKEISEKEIELEKD
jgi:hypothetical protein